MSLAEEITRSVDAAEWLTDADAGAVALLLNLAELQEGAPSSRTGTAILQAMNALGLTLVGRDGRVAADHGDGDELEKYRAARSA